MSPAAAAPLRAGPLRLEPLQPAHAPEMFELLQDPALYEFENQPPTSLAWLQARYARLAAGRSDDGRETWLNWIVRLPSGEAAGYVQATVMQGGSAYLGYEIASRHWRRGIASTALRAVMDELAQRHGVQVVLAVLKAANHRSLGLLRHLGFSDTAPLKAVRADCSSDEIVMHRRP